MKLLSKDEEVALEKELEAIDFCGPRAMEIVCMLLENIKPRKEQPKCETELSTLED